MGRGRNEEKVVGVDREGKGQSRSEGSRMPMLGNCGKLMDNEIFESFRLVISWHFISFLSVAYFGVDGELGY